MVIERLASASKDLFKWFENNTMKVNSEKCDLLLFTNQQVTVTFNQSLIQNSN